MKDFIQIWNRVAGKSYTSVAQHDRELRELPTNRLRPGDIETFEANFAECEGLNSRLDDVVDFGGKKEAIINKLFEKRRRGHVARQPKNLFLLLMLGFIALGAGFFILLIHPYDILFKLKAVLSEGGEIYEMWRKPEVDLYTKIYLFNVTNSAEFLAGIDDKLKLQEVGPYVYKESLEHKNVTFNPNGTLSATPVHPLTWVEELSEGNKETDRVIMPNIALLSIANVAAKRDFFMRLGLNTLISTTNSKALVEMTAREFMFGYESPLVGMGNTFMPGWIKFAKLGLIDRMYDFEGDFETVFTGEDDVSNSGLLDTYRGSTDLPQWNGKHCSNIQYASDGTKFKSNVGMNTSILFFRKSLCRPAPLIAVEDGFKGDLYGYRYTFPEHMLDNGKYLEENKCYCRNGDCLPDGLIDVTECYYGFPIALSYPHFYQGEERLFKHVEGLNPDPMKHETHFWVQPQSGLPLDVSSKFQINMALQDLSSITNAGRFSNVYLPMLWFDITMFELPESMAYKFKLYLNVLPVVEKAAMYLLFGVGSALVLVAVYRLAFKVMFKSFDNKKNIVFDNAFDDKKSKSGVYAACEIPIDHIDRRTSMKSHVDKVKEISHRLSDKVYDSVESFKDKIREIPHVMHVFENEQRRGSLLKHDDDNSNINDGFNDNDYGYRIVKTEDSDEECHMEVIDDGSQFDEMMKDSNRRMSKEVEAKIQRLNSLEGVNSDSNGQLNGIENLNCSENDGFNDDDDLMISTTDLRIDV